MDGNTSSASTNARRRQSNKKYSKRESDMRKLSEHSQQSEGSDYQEQEKSSRKHSKQQHGRESMKDGTRKQSRVENLSGEGEQSSMLSGTPPNSSSEWQTSGLTRSEMEYRRRKSNGTLLDQYFY